MKPFASNCNRKVAGCKWPRVLKSLEESWWFTINRERASRIITNPSFFKMFHNFLNYEGIRIAFVPMHQKVFLLKNIIWRQQLKQKFKRFHFKCNFFKHREKRRKTQKMPFWMSKNIWKKVLPHHWNVLGLQGFRKRMMKNWRRGLGWRWF